MATIEDLATAADDLIACYDARESEDTLYGTVDCDGFDGVQSVCLILSSMIAQKRSNILHSWKLDTGSKDGRRVFTLTRI